MTHYPKFLLCGSCIQPKKYFKVQIIGIFEKIDSFYWPKMHLWNGDKKFGQYGLYETKSVEWVKYSMSPLSPLCLWQCLFVLSGHYGLCGQQMGASASSLKPPIWPPTIPLFRDLTIINSIYDWINFFNSVCNCQIDETHNMTEYTRSRTVWQFVCLSFHFFKTSDNRWRFHIGLCFFNYPSIIMNNAYYPFNTAGKCLFQSCQNNSDTTGLSLFITLKSDYCLSFINCGRK